MKRLSKNQINVVVHAMVGNGLLRGDVTAVGYDEIFAVYYDTGNMHEILEIIQSDRMQELSRSVIKEINSKYPRLEYEKESTMPTVIGAALATGNFRQYDYRDLPKPFNNPAGYNEINSWVDVEKRDEIKAAFDLIEKKVEESNGRSDARDDTSSGEASWDPTTEAVARPVDDSG